MTEIYGMKPTREEIIAAEKAAGWSGIYSQWESPTERTHTTVPVTQEQIDRFFLAAYKAGMLRAAEIAKDADLHNGDFLKNSDPRITVCDAIRAEAEKL